jgi:hypothetical protein
MPNNYHDAFIPILNVARKATNFVSSSHSLTQKITFKKQTSIFSSKKSRKNFLIMKNSSEIKDNPIEIIKKELGQTKKDWKSTVRTLPSSYRRIVSVLIFASFILSSWYLVPSRNRYISVTASVLSSGLAFFLNSKINSKNILGARNKILELISSNVEYFNFKQIAKEVNVEFGVSYEDLKNEILTIYKKYVLIFLRNSEIRVDQIKELIKIKDFLEISSQEVGECHVEIARDLYKEYTVNLERKDSDFSIDKVNKFLFLSDRVFSTDSVKGYQYEISRLRKVFLFSSEKTLNICSSISYSSYFQIINSFFENNLCGLEDIDTIQKLIGIDQEEKEKIHSKFIGEFFDKLISKEKKLTNVENIQKIKDVFKISDSKFQSILINITKPIFYSELFEIINQLTSVVDKQYLINASDAIKTKKIDLLIPSSEISSLISSAIENVLQNLINSIINDLKVKRNTNAFNEIEKIFILKKYSYEVFSSLEFLTKEDVDEIYYNGSFYNMGKSFKYQETNQIFELFIKNSFEEYYLKSESEEKIIELKKILSISNTEYINIYNSITEPIFKQQIIEAIEKKNLTRDNSDTIKRLQLSLKLDTEFALDIKINVYKSYLQFFSEENSILSVENTRQLNEIKKFLSLKWSNIQDIHDGVNEPFFKKAVAEAMGASGFISINYWDSLEKLRKRLQMTEKKARLVFYQVSKDKMRQLFDQAVIEYKRKIQLKSEGKENKEDTSGTITGTALGIEAGNINGSELSNLIDFYNRNKIFIEKESPLNISFNKNLNGLNGRVEITKCMNIKTDYQYPVNLNGVFDKKIVLEMYKQYLVECFSTKLQNEKRKLFNNLDKLGPILGIEKEEIKSIHTNVGSLVYKQFLAQALSKGFIDKSETAFLTTIQNTLAMDNSKCSDLIKEAKKNRVAVFIESIFATPKINPDKVSELRKMALYLGIDLQNDLSVSSDQCAKLFRVEIDSNIEKGLITSENQSLVEEIRSAFGLSNDVVKKVLLESITTRCEGYLINSVASLRKNANEESLKELKKMINYGNLLPIKIQSNFASKSEKEQLFSLFQSLETQKDKLDLLKIMLNL